MNAPVAARTPLNDILAGVIRGLGRLMPGVELSKLCNVTLTPSAAAEEIRIIMWRLRGMRDAADILTDPSGELPRRQRLLAVRLSERASKAFAVCTDALIKLSGLGASVTQQLPTPVWVAPTVPSSSNGAAKRHKSRR